MHLTVAFLMTALASPLAAPSVRADKVVVLKSERKIRLMRQNRILREYRIALGSKPKGPKRREGDGRTPEGKYIIDFKIERSQFHRALHISYPNSADIQWAKTNGFSPGGSIMIHGLPKERAWLGGLHRLIDWTQGCIAVTNEEIDEMWQVVPVGTPIDILP